MAVPADKLNKMFDELVKQSEEKAKSMNMISLEEYKNLNSDKIAYLNFLKKIVFNFNQLDKNFFVGCLANDEIFYLCSIVLKMDNDFDNEKENITRNAFNESNALISLQNIILNDVKKYPNPRLKKNTLKINEKIYKDFLRLKKRTEQIQKEIEENNFAPLKYMEDALQNIEFLCEKAEEYENNPGALLNILEYYYSDAEELEWTDEDREYVAKHYG